MIVLDASAVIEALMRTPKGLLVRQRIFASTDIHAPHLLDVEVLHGLRRMVRRGDMSVPQALMALQVFQDLDIIRYPHSGFMRRIWALRENVSAYDAAYVALAEALGAQLITCDARLGSAPGHSAQVVFVS